MGNKKKSGMLSDAGLSKGIAAVRARSDLKTQTLDLRVAAAQRLSIRGSLGINDTWKS